MNRREQCNRCGSRAMLRVPSTPGQHSHIVLGEAPMHTVAVDTYVCTGCGHVDAWIAGATDLDRLRGELRRLPPEAG